MGKRYYALKCKECGVIEDFRLLFSSVRGSDHEMRRRGFMLTHHKAVHSGAHRQPKMTAIVSPIQEHPTIELPNMNRPMPMSKQAPLLPPTVGSKRYAMKCTVCGVLPTSTVYANAANEAKRKLVASSAVRAHMDAHHSGNALKWWAVWHGKTERNSTPAPEQGHLPTLAPAQADPPVQSPTRLHAPSGVVLTSFALESGLEVRRSREDGQLVLSDGVKTLRVTPAELGEVLRVAQTLWPELGW